MKALTCVSRACAASLFVTARAECGSSPGAYCCSSLVQAGLGSKVYFPGSTLYESRMESYWSVSAALDPWCVVQPSDAEDVSTTIKTLVSTNCTFGVRGGGHGSFAGCNSVSDGVTIDFGNLNSTSYDSTTGLATVRPGNHWQYVYESLEPYGVTVTGGRAGTVGVGGFVTGGGNSFHAASHGMACDNVANWEVVLANGSIINANATHNSDLWTALKGGSANFGLVTAFDMYSIPFEDPSVPDIWGGNLIYNLSEPGVESAVINAFVDFANNIDADQNSSSIIYWAYVPTAGGMLLNAALENTLAISNASAFDGYRSVPGISADTTAVDSMADITLTLGSGQPSGYRNIWFTLSFSVDARIINYAVERHYDLVSNLSSVMAADSGFNTLCMFQPLPTVLSEHSVEKGGNVMGLDYYAETYGNGVLFLLTFAVNASEPDQEALARPYLRAYTDDVASYAESLGLLWDWKYLNYADKTQDAIATFGDAAIAKMKAVSEKYDPDGVFQTLRGSGFKLPA